MQKIKNLIFDADDTLWENNNFFVKTTDLFFELCAKSGYEYDKVKKAFYEFELKVVKDKGYGSDNFIYILEYLFTLFNKNKTLDQSKFDSILEKFNSHTFHEPPVFPGVSDILKLLNQDYDLYVLTKGNIEEQQNKINRSGLKHYFKEEFVLPEKNDATYISILEQYDWQGNECCMIGNSPKSDINPALRSGMFAIFIPYKYTWTLDNEELIKDHSNLFEIKNFKEIPKILDKLH